MSEPVFFLLNSLSRGGAERVVLALVAEYSKSGALTPVVVCLEERPDSYDPPRGIEVIYLSKYGAHPLQRVSSHLLGLARLCRLKWAHPRSVFISFLVRANILNAVTRILVRQPPGLAILSERTRSDQQYQGASLRSRAIRKLIRVSYNTARAIIAISDGVAAGLRQLGVTRPQLITIYNPLLVQAREVWKTSYDDWRGSPHAVEWQKEDGREVADVIVVGRLVPAKNPELALRVAAKLIHSGRNMRLHFFGDGPLRSKLEDTSRAFAIDRFVIFHGWVDESSKIYGHADIFLLTSDFEGFGNVILEALSYGVPTVCTDCPSGPSEILGDGEFGLLVPARSEERIADAVASVLDDPALARKLSQAGIRRSQDFDLTKIAEQYLEVIQRSSARTLSENA